MQPSRTRFHFKDALGKQAPAQSAYRRAALIAMLPGGAKGFGRSRARSALVRRNTELEARLAERNAELARSNQALESFSYSVGHDLRAPLRAVLGFGQMLREDHGDRLSADALGNLERMLAAAARMGRMFDDLLHLSRLGRQALVPVRVDMAALCRELIAEFATAEPGVSASLVVPDSLQVSADGGLLRIALQHLIGNAWKFAAGATPRRIEIGQTQSPHGRAFFVRDNGAGFDMAYAGKLFKVFQRLHSESEFSGAGVGLATVEHIVRRHGGRIWAQAAPGLGATFYFTLPAQRGSAVN